MYYRVNRVKGWVTLDFYDFNGLIYSIGRSNLEELFKTMSDEDFNRFKKAKKVKLSWLKKYNLSDSIQCPSALYYFKKGSLK